MKNRRKTTSSTGARGEKLICDKLRARGVRIIDQNVREKFAEALIIRTTNLPLYRGDQVRTKLKP